MSEQISIRMDGEVKKRLEKMAERKGMKLAEYIKDWAFTGYNIDEETTEDSRLQLIGFKDSKEGEVMKFKIRPPKELKEE